jgi:hypothetical protein
VKIPGYENDPLIDGVHLLDERSFWPVHLLQCTRGEPGELCSTFGVEEADLWQFYDRTSDEQQWPVFSISLPSRHVLHVVYRNIAGDAGYDYVLHRPDWAATVWLATIDGHFRGPGLCWPELLAAARTGTGAGQLAAPEARMLLLLPVMADDELPADAEARLAGALTACGATGDARGLARAVLNDQGLWGPRHWRFEHGSRVTDSPWVPAAWGPAVRQPGPADGVVDTMTTR